jgi:hypothetical protein
MRGLPSFLLLPACALALGAMPLLAQDDNGGGPPPPASDNSAPPMQDNGGAPPQADYSAPAQDQSAPGLEDPSGASTGSITFQTFYDALSGQGTWIQTSDYGYVWQPQESDPAWAPYTQGHWVYSDDGWTWVSDESFGWATYHYGRWVNLEGTGWVWVPGYTWAPAWVSWRYGDGDAGWAPLPPDSFVGVDYSDDGNDIGSGFHIGGDCDDFYGIGPGCYIFLPVSCLGYGNYRGYYHQRGDNFGLINHTINVTNINITRGRGATGGGTGYHHVTAGGPMLAQVNAVSATPIQRVSLVRASQPNGGGTLTGNSLALYAPRVNPGATAQPPRVDGSIGRATINRGTDVMRPLAVNSRLAGSAATEAQVQEARVAQDHVPASAKVMTDETSVRPVLQEPLTSMKPVARETASGPVMRPYTPPDEISTSPRVSPEVLAPTARTYPQTDEPGAVPSRVYYPETVSPSPSPYYRPQPSTTVAPGAGSQQIYSRSGGAGGAYSSAPSAPAPHESAPAAHESSGGTSSSGGYSGGASRGGTSTSGGGGVPAGGGYSGGGASGGGGHSGGGPGH